MGMAGQLQHWIARRAVRRRFAVLRCAGRDVLDNLPADRAAIVCPIHTSWWDGFFASWLLARVPGRRFVLVQEEQHLARYPWFRRAGVLGIDATTPGRLRAGLREIRRTLEDPTVMMVYFPQGKLTVQDDGPVTLRRGIGHLAGGADVPVVPVVWRHGLREGSKSEVWIKVCPPLRGAGDALVTSLQEAMSGGVAGLAADWRRGDASGYVPLFPPAQPINDWWLQVTGRGAGQGEEKR